MTLRVIHGTIDVEPKLLVCERCKNSAAFKAILFPVIRDGQIEGIEQLFCVRCLAKDGEMVVME